MLTFTQNGGKILSGGYLINSKLLNKTMTEKMGVPAGLQVGGNEQNIETLRPNVGISAEKYFKVLGKKTNRKIRKNSPIFGSDLK